MLILMFELGAPFEQHKGWQNFIFTEYLTGGAVVDFKENSLYLTVN